MVYLEIDKTKSHLIDDLNKYLIPEKNKIFILIYMEGCGPCNETRPEWAKLKNVLSEDFLNKQDVIIVSIDKDLVGKVKNIKSEPRAFPTIRFITDAGDTAETYEDSDISVKDRSIDSFVEWIKSKSRENNITISERKSKRRPNYTTSTRKVYRKMRGGKWSAKYKRSINCKRPKGFSQRQYCKYGRKSRK